MQLRCNGGPLDNRWIDNDWDKWNPLQREQAIEIESKIPGKNEVIIFQGLDVEGHRWIYYADESAREWRSRRGETTLEAFKRMFP